MSSRFAPRRLYLGLRRRAYAQLRRAFDARPIRPLRRRPAPLLIVGAPRTGSSFIVRALVNAAGFAGMAEGHVTPLMAALDATIVQYYQSLRSRGLLDIPQNTIANIPEDKLRREIVAVFERFDRGLFPFAKRILDKTVNVEAINALPFLLQIWPSAKVLYLKRDGIENVVSAIDYFKVPLSEAATNWANCGVAWDRVRGLIPAESYLEVDHWQLTDDPVHSTERLARHLGLDARTRERLLDYVAQDTKQWASLRTRRPALPELGWESARMEEFLAICGDQMIRQGYASAEEIATVQALGQVPSEDALRQRVQGAALGAAGTGPAVIGA